jgi:hypothetical protein
MLPFYFWMEPIFKGIEDSLGVDNDFDEQGLADKVLRDSLSNHTTCSKF